MITSEYTRNKKLRRFCRAQNKTVAWEECVDCRRECKNEDGKEGKRTEGHARYLIIK